MKTKKFNLNWQSVLLGMVLCMVLVVFVGSNAQATQVVSKTQATQTEAARTVVSQKAVSMNVLMDKLELIDQRILVVEGRVTRLQEQMDYLLKNMEVMWRENKK